MCAGLARGSYLWDIKLWEFAFEFSNVVVGFVARDPYCACRSWATKGVQIERTGRRLGATRGWRGKSGDLTLPVEGYIWKGGCGAFKVDIGVVEEVSHLVKVVARLGLLSREEKV